jgi:eukaryotic-like serine/threonine-protein kinase
VTASFAQAPVQEGEILDGKYRVDQVLGVGGMGVVVAATHVQLNTKVALKFLLPEVLNEPKIVDRFVREARSAVQIQSEYVARVTDVSTLPSGSPYMVMEFLEGQDLAEHLAKNGPLPVTQVVGYLLQACEAVAEAHSLGIVHRDLKPANLFLAQRNRREAIVKVLDFGISKSKDSGALNLTKTASMMGSPYYMSPEQMKSSRDVDPRSDIWAIGIIMFELLAGSPPFEGATITELVVSVTTGKLPSIRELRPEVPSGLADVIVKCLQRDPDKRYADVGALAKALAPFGPPRSDVSVERISRILGAASIQPPPQGMPAGSTVTTASSTMQGTASAWANSQESSRPKHRGLVIMLAAVVAMLAISVIVWKLTSSRPVPPAVASTAIPSVSTSALVAATEAPAPSASPAPIVLVPQAASVAPVAPVAATAATSASTQSAHAVAPVAAKTVGKAATGRSKDSPKASSPVAAPAAPAANRGLNMGMKE